MIPTALKVVKTTRITKQIFEQGNDDCLSAVLSSMTLISLASETSYSFRMISLVYSEIRHLGVIRFDRF